jgi:hypothetical protein
MAWGWGTLPKDRVLVSGARTTLKRKGRLLGTNRSSCKRSGWFIMLLVGCSHGTNISRGAGTTIICVIQSHSSSSSSALQITTLQEYIEFVMQCNYLQIVITDRNRTCWHGWHDWIRSHGSMAPFPPLIFSFFHRSNEFFFLTSLVSRSDSGSTRTSVGIHLQLTNSKY